jgi:hypothetical protein
MIKIDKDIPPPSTCKYEVTLAQMVPGDSFFIEGSLTGYARNALYRELKRAKGTFTTRVVDGGVRVWRRT